VTLTYRDEYVTALRHGSGHDHDHAHPHGAHEAEPGALRIQLLQEFLTKKLPELGIRRPSAPASSRSLLLFGHCTERTAEVRSQEQWREVFRAFGIEVEAQGTGCCGMCGVYGHEADHFAESKGVFEMSWGKRLPREAAAQRQVLAAGHSCRSQVKRFAGFVPRHPMEALRDALAESPAEAHPAEPLTVAAE